MMKTIAEHINQEQRIENLEGKVRKLEAEIVKLKLERMQDTFVKRRDKDDKK